jgi:hypothetical protein
VVLAAGSNAAALEAAGVADVGLDFRGTAVTIPLDIASWPLDLIRAGRTGRAIQVLLGGQKRPSMKTRDDALELTHRMADACGITPLPETPAKGAFGAVPTLLDIVDNYRDDLEADLRRFYGIDYRDPAAVTLRQVWVMARRLPVDSALLCARNGGEPPWTRDQIIGARNWELWTRKHYDGRPWSKPEIDAAINAKKAQEDDLAKLKDRENYYASGQNMRDAGLDTSGMAFAPPPTSRPQQSDPADAALAVAKKNAARSLKHRKAASSGRTTQPGFSPVTGRWNPAGSGW